MADDVYEALRQVKGLLDGIDLPPRQLEGQEDYDAIAAAVDCRCPAEGSLCERCAFDLPDEDCALDKIRLVLANARGRRCLGLYPVSRPRRYSPMRAGGEPDVPA